MSMADDVRRHFERYTLGPPCSSGDIARAEAALGGPLPVVLRDLYSAFNGFVGPTQAAFFWPLQDREFALVEMNKFYRANDDLFPAELVSKCVFFGDGGGGQPWAVHADLPDKVIYWDVTWGNEFEVVGGTPLEVWLAEKKCYDDLSA